MEGQLPGEPTASPILQDFFPQCHQYWIVSGGGKSSMACSLPDPTSQLYDTGVTREVTSLADTKEQSLQWAGWYKMTSHMEIKLEILYT